MQWRRSFLNSALGDEAAAAFARQHFRYFRSRKVFRLINGKTLSLLSECAGDRFEFRESICNAGLVQTTRGYTCVARNQKFAACDSATFKQGREPVGSLDDGVRLLYRIDFDTNWNVTSVQKLRVFLN